MNRIRFSAAVVFILIVITASMGQKPGAGQKPKEPPPDYYPLRVGEWWKYQSTTGDNKQSEFTMKVLADEKQSDGTLLYQVEIMSTIPIHEWYSKPDGWVIWHREAYPKNDMKVTFESVRQFLKNPPAIGSA